MKTEEMADLLDGFVTFSEKYMGRSDLKDLRSVSSCLRQFSGETVTAFCNFVANAKEGKPARQRSAPAIDANKVNTLASKVKAFLENTRGYEYSRIVHIVGELNKLNLAEIKAVGEQIECTLTGRTKTAVIKELRNWLESIKLSSDQTSFGFSGAGKAS